MPVLPTHLLSPTSRPETKGLCSFDKLLLAVNLDLGSCDLQLLLRFDGLRRSETKSLRSAHPSNGPQVDSIQNENENFFRVVFKRKQFKTRASPRHDVRHWVDGEDVHILFHHRLTTAVLRRFHKKWQKKLVFRCLSNQIFFEFVSLFLSDSDPTNCWPGQAVSPKPKALAFRCLTARHFEKKQTSESYGLQQASDSFRHPIKLKQSTY